MKKILIFAILFVIAGQLITGCSSDTSSPQQTSLPTPTPTPSKIDVTFKITGTTKAAGMDYRCMVSTDYQSHYVFVPWEESRTCWNDPDGKITLAAYFYNIDYVEPPFPNSSGTGTLTCEIYVDGELVDSDSETVEVVKGWPSAKCSYLP
jgi:hypothetical protein